MFSRAYLLCLLLTVLKGVACSSDAADDEGYFKNSERLYDDLMKNYYKSVTPQRNGKDPVILEINIESPRVETLDTETDTLTMSFMLHLTWTDPRLAWNKTDYGGLAHTRLPSNQLWMPDFTVYNTSPYSKSESKGETYAIVYESGTIYHVPVWTVSAFCGIKFEHFPYDTQKCKLVMGSWVYSGQELMLKLRAGSNKNQMEVVLNEDSSLTSEHPQWEMQSMIGRIKIKKYECCAETYPNLEIDIEMKRRSSYYRFALVGPSVLVAFLVPVMFLLPTDSPNKSTFGMLLLLCTTILVMVLQEAVPFTHASVPRLSYFFFCTMVLEVVSIVLSTIVSWVASKGTQHQTVPAWLNSLCLNSRLVRRLMCMDAYSPVNSMATTMNMRLMEDNGEISEGMGHDPAELHNVDMTSNDGLHNVANFTKIMAGDVLAKNAYAKITHEWLEIARFLDRLFFVAFMIMFLLTTISFLS